MKVLQINCVYNAGSTGKIMMDLHRGLEDLGIESIQCYGRGVAVCQPGVYKTCGELYSKANNLLSRFSGLMYGGCFFSTNKLISIIKKEKPDVVHLHCINGYFVNIYRLITWLKKSRIKTVLTLHAEFMHTANCGYALDCDRWKTGCGKCPRRKEETKSLLFDGTAWSWKKMKRAFDGFDTLTAASVSPWIMGRAMQSPILKGKHHVVVLNGLDAGVFHPVENSDLRERWGIGEKKLVLHVTASFSLAPEHIKGGCHVVEMASRMPEVMFAVVGNGAVEQSDLPDNMIFVGRAKTQQELAEWYSTADVTLLTSKKETFSMVTAESLCCGTPVVGFEAGGPETIALPNWGHFVKWGDLDALECALEQRLQRPKELSAIAGQACRAYSAQTMLNRYFGLYMGEERK